MTKLIVFSEPALVEPISGGTFVQHPQDQQLRPGVSEKLAQLQSDGVQMAIASNQGGCAKLDLEANQLKIGMWWHTPKYGTAPWKISDIQSIDDRVCVFGESEETDGGKWNATIASDEPDMEGSRCMSKRVKVEIHRYFDDKYHGRIMTGGTNEWFILCRKHFFSRWVVESCGEAVIDDRVGVEFDWFPVRVGQTYDPFGKFVVKVEKASEAHHE